MSPGGQCSLVSAPVILLIKVVEVGVTEGTSRMSKPEILHWCVMREVAHQLGLYGADINDMAVEMRCRCGWFPWIATCLFSFVDDKIFHGKFVARSDEARSAAHAPH